MQLKEASEIVAKLKDESKAKLKDESKAKLKDESKAKLKDESKAKLKDESKASLNSRIDLNEGNRVINQKWPRGGVQSGKTHEAIGWSGSGREEIEAT